MGDQRAKSDQGWLADTRTSYDTVAASYAERYADALAGEPYLRATLDLFAELTRGAGGGPVADVGCGPGHVTAYLCERGVDAFGIDLSPAMVRLARSDHPGLRFEVGSMTDPQFADSYLADSSLAGLLAWYSLIHVPDDEVPAVLGRFHRALRPGGVLLLGFHVGDEHRLKTEGYGGHPMRVFVHKRPVERIAAWLRAAGLAVEAELILGPDETAPHAMVLARRPARSSPATSSPAPSSPATSSPDAHPT